MRPRSRQDFTVAIVCALSFEADAVEALFDETYDRLGRYYGKQQGDANAYINGRIGNHNVVLCYLSGIGKVSAASAASRLQVSYTRIELALVVGVCGGAPSSHQDIFLGDAIISDSVIAYDFGRQYPGGFQRKPGVKDILGRPNREIRTLLNGLRAANALSELQNQMQEYLETLQQKETKWCHPQINDNLFQASYLHKHYARASDIQCGCSESDVPEEICDSALEETCDDLGCDKGQVIRCREFEEAAKASICIGTVASADRVMKPGPHRDAIVRKEKVIGFETAGAGVWDNISCIIIKGVCDYADSHKNKLWQEYAAATGASAAKAFLEYWPRKKEDTPKTVHFVVPFARNHRFVGRQEEIDRLEELISTPDGPKKIAITGLGGVGKTQVALELAYRMQDREDECSIFWIPCTSYEAVEQACMAIAQTIGIQAVNPAEVKEHLKAHFSQRNGKWLLIFDNADDMDMWMKGSKTSSALKDFLPCNNNGHTIFTTRNRKVAVRISSSHEIHVPKFNEETGVDFLGNEDFGDDERYKEIQNPVIKTWLTSFYQIQKLDGLAFEYLSLMACLDPRNSIPESFLPRPASKKKMTEALGLLKAYSFIAIQPGNGSITLHRLVHLATRAWMKNEKQYVFYITKAADRLNEAFPGNDHTNRQLCREYLPHALFLLSDNQFKKQQDMYIDLIRGVGSCLSSDGRYNEAEKLLSQMMETQKQELGPEHPDTLASMANLPLSSWKRGQWKEAKKLFSKIMNIRKQELRPEHSDTLASIHNLHQDTKTKDNGRRQKSWCMHYLAYTWKSLGNIQPALDLVNKCVELRNEVLGSNYPDFMSSYNALKNWEAEVNSSSAKNTTKSSCDPILLARGYLGTGKKRLTLIALASILISLNCPRYLYSSKPIIMLRMPFSSL
ncbi:hypothetical protein ANOM_008428 [Aspergillus nomiae NRRL 13137]|uniref:AAA+ ATPase domain-containing protein n=1 Tax=Aspergillus nomiae NRRL (strain ATCC 15546 / NRRL 13137 / CBS 260.88 / M93) TaxID=1509407 RepID=A0A0L1IXP0_ASPN3|nr:uncharacterized protein ANOM_008428 [Aspergillus nomiae NRRL 13137]KNG84272.1 hypothetical protein ANOM_008428 [Aspergillus nomiae NRRL 13137]